MLNSEETLNQQFVQYFADKDRSFYEWGIMNITEKWKNVINQNGPYIINQSLLFI